MKKNVELEKKIASLKEASLDRPEKPRHGRIKTLFSFRSKRRDSFYEGGSFDDTHLEHV